MVDMILITLCMTVCVAALTRSFANVRKLRKKLDRIQTLMRMYDKGLISPQQIGEEMGVPVYDIQDLPQESSGQSGIIANINIVASQNPCGETPFSPPEPEKTIERHELLDFE